MNKQIKQYLIWLAVLILAIVAVLLVLNLLSFKEVQVSVANDSLKLSYSQDNGQKFEEFSSGQSLRLKKGADVIIRVVGGGSERYQLIEVNGQTPDSIEIKTSEATASTQATQERPLKHPFRAENYFYGINPNIAAVSISRENKAVFPKSGQFFFGIPAVEKLVWLNEFSFYYLTLDGKIGLYNLATNDLIDTEEYGRISDIAATNNNEAIAASEEGLLKISGREVQSQSTNISPYLVELLGSTIVSAEKAGNNYNVYQSDLSSPGSISLLFRSDEEITGVFSSGPAVFLSTRQNIYKFVDGDLERTYYFDNLRDSAAAGSTIYLLSSGGVWRLNDNNQSIVLLSKTQEPFQSMADSLIYDKSCIYWGSEAIDGVDYEGQEPGQYSFRSIKVN